MGSSPISNTNLLRPLLTKRSSAPKLYHPVKGYKKGSKEEEERAPSLADEFRRVAEEKAKAMETKHVAEKQGVASQTSDKTYDGGEEATLDHGDVQSVKKRFEEHEPAGPDYRRRG